jgi:hypothetical protein
LGRGGAHAGGSYDDPGYGLPTADQLVGLHPVASARSRHCQDQLGNFFFVVGVQGTMQVLTIVIMARFVTGL